MINFYQLILTTDFENFEISQIWVEILAPNIGKVVKIVNYLHYQNLESKFQLNFEDMYMNL
jgi:hypothetical protein